MIESSGTGNPTVGLYDTNSSGNPSEGAELWYQSSTGNSFLSSLYSSGALIFSTAAGTGYRATDSERFRIASSGQLGIGGANYGTDGQILTSTGASTAPAWEDAAEGGISAGKAIAMAIVFG